MRTTTDALILKEMLTSDNTNLIFDVCIHENEEENDLAA
jgi:hypothetical protein